jgi:hypothetical protein
LSGQLLEGEAFELKCVFELRIAFVVLVKEHNAAAPDPFAHIRGHE